MRSEIRKQLFRNRWLRQLCSPLLAALLHAKGSDLSYLAFFPNESAFGPIQRDEALLLAALIRMTKPRTIVEFGFSQGHSALNFLENMGRGDRLFSYDVSKDSRDLAEYVFGSDERFVFIHKSQTDFDPDDVGHRPIDLCFIDAAHSLDLNKETWIRISGQMANDGLVLVHDTGVWARERMSASQLSYAESRPDQWLSHDEFQPHPEERQFMNWICQIDADWTPVHFHTTRVLRHGLSLLQRRRTLNT